MTCGIRNLPQFKTLHQEYENIENNWYETTRNNNNGNYVPFKRKGNERVNSKQKVSIDKQKFHNKADYNIPRNTPK